LQCAHTGICRGPSASRYTSCVSSCQLNRQRQTGRRICSREPTARSLGNVCRITVSLGLNR
jgi:hypothetical protein